jgi:glycerol-3-phosphate acyltransferase PlsY
MNEISVIVVAYLAGCINTGYYLVRILTGQDIRTTASGNTGSRNVGRLLGVKGFALTFIGDAGKGAAVVWFANYMKVGHLTATAALLMVVAGHIWPVQLGFRGGKGFATLIGGMLILDPFVLFTGILLSVAVFAVVRATTKAGLVALACTPAIILIRCIRCGDPLHSGDFLLYCVLVVIVLYAHRSNIRKEFFRLRSGSHPEE